MSLKMPSTLMLLLLASQMPLLSNCQTQCDESADIDTVRRCISMYEQLETAVLAPENLYKLRHAFIPVSRQQPTLMIINYEITRSKMCNETLDMNDTVETVTHGWSDSAIFTAIHPLTLWETQAAFLQLLLPEKIWSLYKVTLHLCLHSDYETSSSQHFDDSLVILTSRLKAITRVQDKLIEWNGSDQGYVWDYPQPPHVEFSKILPLSMILVLLFFVLVIVLAPKVRDYIDSGRCDDDRKGKIRITFFVTAGFALLVDVLEIWFDIFLLVSELCNDLRALCISKPLTLLVIITLAIIASSVVTYIFSENQTWKNIMYWFAFLFITLFLFFVVRSFISTLILLFVYPIETISSIVFAFATLFFGVSLTTVCVSDVLNRIASDVLNTSTADTVPDQSCKKVLELVWICLLYAILVLLLILAVGWFAYIYRLVLESGVHSDSLLNILPSVFPSAILTTVAVFLEKRLFRQDEPVSQT